MIIGIASLSSWLVIFGVALMLVGGFVLWACSARKGRDVAAMSLALNGPEAESVRAFHLRLVNWFHRYALCAMILGFGLLATIALH